MAPHPIATVFIVDDDELQCWFWQKTLEKRYGDRARIEAFGDAREALGRLGPDVTIVLLDWHMPHLDAKTFLGKAREKGLGPDRFILFSGSDKALAEEEFGSTGCLAIVEKGRPEQEALLFQLLDGRLGLSLSKS